MIGLVVVLIDETLQELILRPQKLSLLLLKFVPITCIYYILLHIETLQDIFNIITGHMIQEEHQVLLKNHRLIVLIGQGITARKEQ